MSIDIVEPLVTMGVETPAYDGGATVLDGPMAEDPPPPDEVMEAPFEAGALVARALELVEVGGAV